MDLLRGMRRDDGQFTGSKICMWDCHLFGTAGGDEGVGKAGNGGNDGYGGAVVRGQARMMLQSSFIAGPDQACLALYWKFARRHSLGVTRCKGTCCIEIFKTGISVWCSLSRGNPYGAGAECAST